MAINLNKTICSISLLFHIESLSWASYTVCAIPGIFHHIWERLLKSEEFHLRNFCQDKGYLVCSLSTLEILECTNPVKTCTLFNFHEVSSFANLTWLMDICFISNGKINKLKNCIFRSIYCSLPVVLIRLKLIHISFKKKKIVRCFSMPRVGNKVQKNSDNNKILSKCCQNIWEIWENARGNVRYKRWYF